MIQQIRVQVTYGMLGQLTETTQLTAETELAAKHCQQGDILARYLIEQQLHLLLVAEQIGQRQLLGRHQLQCGDGIDPLGDQLHPRLRHTDHSQTRASRRIGRQFVIVAAQLHHRLSNKIFDRPRQGTWQLVIRHIGSFDLDLLEQGAG